MMDWIRLHCPWCASLAWHVLTVRLEEWQCRVCSRYVILEQHGNQVRMHAVYDRLPSWEGKS